MKWDDLQLALAVARHGSHSAAARALGVTQPTVGRRLAAMERALGAPLFERLPDGLRLTRLGKSAVMNAEQIEARVLATERLARASNDDLSGVVRVTASDWLATRVLPAAIAELTRRAPGLQLHVVASARLWRLTRNEADLALRPARFDANGIYQRVVGDVAFGLYASRGYLAARGMPPAGGHAEGHALISMDDTHGSIADVDWLRRVAARARVVACVNGRDAMAALAASGAGLACLPRLIGDATPGLVQITSFGEAPARRLWLGVHRDRRGHPQVAAVAAGLKVHLSRVLPRDDG